MYICDIIAFIYSFICQDFVAREINRSEGISRHFSYNNCYYYCAYLSINAAYHVRPNITYSEEYNKILQIYPLYTYRDSYEINTNFTFIPFSIYITAGELSVHK